MKAILLAAGFGIRLQPLTNKIPKCLAPIKNKPLLEYWLNILDKAGINSFLINTHYKSDIVSKFIENSVFNEKITISHEKNLLGTAGAILKNKDFFKNEPFMLVHADNLCLADFSEFIKAHQNRPKNTEITMMTFDADNPSECGIVEIDDQKIVKNFYEKPKSLQNIPRYNNKFLANAAVYIVEPSIINFLEKLNKKAIDFSTEVLPSYIGKIYTYHNNIYHKDIGTKNNFIEAQNAPIENLEFRKCNSWEKIYKKYNLTEEIKKYL
jgi:mannose-1-phosphate guanylyltransferase